MTALTATDLSGPLYLPVGPSSTVDGVQANFLLKRRWRPGVATGFVVQEIYVEMHVFDIAGHETTHWTRYWEAWDIVDATTTSPAFDFWTIRLGFGTRGRWLKSGVAYVVAALPADFRTGVVPDAGPLRATYTEPTGLGRGMVHRRVQGEWDGVLPGPPFHHALHPHHAHGTHAGPAATAPHHLGAGGTHVPPPHVGTAGHPAPHLPHH